MESPIITTSIWPRSFFFSQLFFVSLAPPILGPIGGLNLGLNRFHFGGGCLGPSDLSSEKGDGDAAQDPVSSHGCSNRGANQRDCPEPTAAQGSARSTLVIEPKARQARWHEIRRIIGRQ
jgi:hypothetical protein